MRRLAIVLFVLFAPMRAQDAGSALSTLVSTRTLRNTAKIGPEQAAEADRLIAAAEKARAARDYSGAIRNFHHANAVMRSQPWDAARQFSSGLTMKIDHSILEPGQTAQLSFGQLYAPQDALPGKVTASIALGETPVKTAEFSVPSSVSITVPEAAEGPYELIANMLIANMGSIGSKRISVRVVKGLMSGVATAEATASKLDPKLPELPSAEGHLARIEAADEGKFGNRIAGMNLNGELNDANAMIADLREGKDPFAGRHGDLRKSYRSAVDSTLQPYRLFVPSAYDGTKAFPLILLLHGMGGDENTMFDLYGKGAFEKLAEQHSYIVACPKGRDPASMYQGAAERDVLDVLADVRRAYKVDPNRIYMTGHSMGAFGTWSIAMDHPELFAALGPISGGGDTSQAAAIAKIPQIVIHGDADPTVPVTQSRAMVAAEKKAGAEVKYLEIPGGNHDGVAVPAFEPIFEWFDTHRRYH